MARSGVSDAAAFGGSHGYDEPGREDCLVRAGHGLLRGGMRLAHLVDGSSNASGRTRRRARGGRESGTETETETFRDRGGGDRNL